MSSTLVLDANIIIRAVLGEKVRDHLLEFSEVIDFFYPRYLCRRGTKTLTDYL